MRGHETGEPRLHGLIPNLGFELIREAIGGADDLLQAGLLVPDRAADPRGRFPAGRSTTPEQRKAQAIIARSGRRIGTPHPFNLSRI